MGKNIIDVILRLVDELSPGFRKATQEVKQGSQEMAQGSNQVAEASGKAAVATKQVGDAAEEAGQKKRKAAADAAELRQGYQQLAVAATAAMVAMTMAITSGIAANNQQVAAFTGLKSVVIGTGRDYDQARQFVQKFTEDGLISQAKAAEALKNLLQRGFSLDEAIAMLGRLKDAASFGRQAHLDMGQAVASASEGLRNEMSILVDNAGVTKNVSIMWKEYAAQLGKGVQSLTLAEKRQAEYNGIMNETRHQVGDAVKLTGTFAGEQAKVTKATYEASAALGRAWSDALKNVLPLWTGLMNGLKTAMDRFPGLTVAIMAVVGAFAALAAAAGIYATVTAPAVISAMAAIAARAGVMWAAITGPVGIVIAALAAVAGAVYYLAGTQERAAKKTVESARQHEQAARDMADATRNKVREIANQEADLQKQITDLEKQGSDQRNDLAKQDRERRREQANRLGDALVSALKQRLEEEKTAEEKSLEEQSDALKGFYDRMYDRSKDAHDREIDAARDQADRMKEMARDKADGQLDELRRWADEQERILRDARDKELGRLDAETQAKIDAKQREIDGIDEATKLEEQYDRLVRRNQRINELQAKLQTITDAKEVAKIKKDLAEEVAAKERDHLLATRDAQKQALRNEVEEIRAKAEERRGTIEAKYQSEVEKLRQTTADKKKLIEQDRDTAITAADDVFKARKIRAEETLVEEKRYHDGAISELASRVKTEKEKIHDKYFGKDGLLNEDNLYAQALKLVYDNNQQEILALLDKYEPDWQNQGKDFVQRLADGGTEAKPAVEALAKGINLLLQASTENVLALQDKAGEGAGKLAEINQQLDQARQSLAQLQGLREDANEAAREASRVLKDAIERRQKAERTLKKIQDQSSVAGPGGKFVTPTPEQIAGDQVSGYTNSSGGKFMVPVFGSHHAGGLVGMSGAYRLLQGERVLSRAERERYERVTRLVDGAAVAQRLAPAFVGGGGSITLNGGVQVYFSGGAPRTEAEATWAADAVSRKLLQKIRENGG